MNELTFFGATPRAPKRVFVVHGEPGPAETLAGRIRDELGWAASVPSLGQSFELVG